MWWVDVALWAALPLALLAPRLLWGPKLREQAVLVQKQVNALSTFETKEHETGFFSGISYAEARLEPFRFNMTGHAEAYRKAYFCGPRPQYCLVFDARGHKITCFAPKRIYDRMLVGMRGTLTYRGVHFLSFACGGFRIRRWRF
nr:DUF2500 family protein [Maliibacterium massiliense]